MINLFFGIFCFKIKSMIVYPNAKINIGLNVIDCLPDGYHSIETVFYPIGLYDTLEIKPIENDKPVFSTSGLAIEGNSENNLVFKAYQLLHDSYHIPPVKIMLDKKIPSAAGLGGGSADAAFTLKALNQLFNLNLSIQELESLAAKLGADCAFFIHNQSVFAVGRGNIFKPISLNLKNFYLLLVKPPISVSTAEAYSLVKVRKPEISLEENIYKPITEWKNLIRNDFEDTLFERYPILANIKENLYKMGALYASMSGSGSTIYGIFDEKPRENKNFKNFFLSLIQLA